MAGAGVVGLIKALANIDSEVIIAAINAWLEDHPEATTTVEDGAITYAKLASGLKDILNKKADDDGYYESMTVGDAEQLVATVGVQDKVPYLFRTSGGSIDIGDREVDKVVGASFPWNQLAKPLSSNDWYTANSSVTYANGKATLTATARYGRLMQTSSFVASHKYLLSMDITAYSGAEILIGLGDPSKLSAQGVRNNFTGTGSKQKVDIVGSFARVTGAATDQIIIMDASQSGWDEIIVENVNLIDLTQLFNSTIADYIASLETGTPGTGVAWFRKYFPKLFYKYNAGSMESICADLHKMTGFNQWDEQWEIGYISVTTGQDTSADNKIRAKNYIPIVPGTAYYKKTPVAFWNCYYDADKNFIGYGDAQQGVFTTPENAHYMRFACEAAYGTTYNHDICINLHWDGERDGEYEPYVSHEYQLSPVVLRGIPKLDAGNKLFYDGDTYEADGTVTRRFHEVEITSCSNVGTASTGIQYAQVSIYGYLCVAEASSNKYLSSGKYDFVASAPNISGVFRIMPSGGMTVLYIYDSRFTDKATADDILASEKPHFIYELATPTTEETTPYQTPQIVDDWGTEEYVDALATAQTSPRDVAIPVGHDTTYRNNLRAKLEMAPESPDGDGDYLLRQTSGQNEYVLLEKELPSLPSEDGTYTLKCTVSGSTKTLTWEADAE